VALDKDITNTLNGLVEGLVENSPFFLSWKPDLVDLAISRKFLVSFDSLVKTFPALIAAGTARMTDEESRTVLAVNLYQECGEGDITRTHHAIYRKFLATAGINVSNIRENDFARNWRNRLSEYINKTGSIGEAIGALAAGEFLAQPALGRIYAILKAHYPQADQEYFTKHLELETEHVREITELISKQNSGEVLSGFKFGLSIWEAYFNQLTEFICGKQSVVGSRYE
jgi:pyrroloquinoline quinone (PQQ) biosynthesis protein C